MRWKFRSGYKLTNELGVQERVFETDVALGPRSKHLIEVNTMEENQVNYLTTVITVFPGMSYQAAIKNHVCECL